jgi:hypothetical protein
MQKQAALTIEARMFMHHFKLGFPQLALRLRVDLQSPRKIVPKGRTLEVLQSAENRRSNLICGAVQ